MRIGILTYHWVANFGANLQAFSTYQNLVKLGHEVFFFDYRPIDKIKWYQGRVSSEQIEMHNNFSKKYLPLTNVCYSESDLINTLEIYKPNLVIVGSDAIFRIKGSTSDMNFPNPLWLNWVKQNSNGIKIAALAGSNMGTYFLQKKINKKILKNIIVEFDFISVRDYWTKLNFKLIAAGKSIAKTFDPVFALDDNGFEASTNLSSLFTSLNKSKYVLFSFSKGYLTEEWFWEFKGICNRNNLLVIGLPMPEGSDNLDFDLKINLPLSPIDWYMLIRNSSGYVGERYHAVVTALKNNISFISADYYAHGKLASLGIPIRSKIFDICFSSNTMDRRYNAFDEFRKTDPKKIANLVINKTANFQNFVNKATVSFQTTLNNILNLTKE